MNSNIIEIGNFSIKWYSVLILLGFGLGFLFVFKNRNKLKSIYMIIFTMN